jgi:16S rRNA (guanine527-N7)-methyltransferase
MQQLVQETKELVGISLSRAQISAFERYQAELADWNQRISLTAIRDPEEVRRKHFLDSMSCLLAMQGTPMQRVIDVGSGAGFPGLPLRIGLPEIGLTLVESVHKKAAFLEHVVKALDLEDVEVLPARAEQVGRMPAHREGYDWALARAVAPLPVLVEYLLPLVKVGGKVLAQKGKDAEKQVGMAEKAIGLLGGEFQEMIPVDLPGGYERRYLVVIQKIAETPDKYPRREGIPAKRPL